MRATSPALKTKKLCQATVRRHAGAVGRIPESFLSQEVCKVIMDAAGWALNCLPYVARTFDVCLVAVKRSGDAL